MLRAEDCGGYYANIWGANNYLVSFVFFCKRHTMRKIVLIFERLTRSRFSRSIIQCDFDSVGVRESVSVQLVRVIFFFFFTEENETVFSKLDSQHSLDYNLLFMFQEKHRHACVYIE